MAVFFLLNHCVPIVWVMLAYLHMIEPDLAESVTKVYPTDLLFYTFLCTFL